MEIEKDQTEESFSCKKCGGHFILEDEYVAHAWHHLSESKSKEKILAEKSVYDEVENSLKESPGESITKKLKLESILPKLKRREVKPKKNILPNTKENEITKKKEASPLPKSPKNEKVDPDAELQKLLETIEGLTDDQIKLFNLTNNQIDENSIGSRVENYYGNTPYHKVSEFKSSRIAWASWRFKGQTIYWPCLIEKVAKDNSGKLKAFIKYYELGLDIKEGNTFKLDLSKVELFFRNVKEHFALKELATMIKPLRYEFFNCYTNALKDFVRQLEEMEKNGLLNIANKDSDETQNDSEVDNSKKYLVQDKYYSLEEVKDLANKPISEDLEKNIAGRKESSAKLLDVLLTDECKDFLISIINGTHKCNRHKSYINGDALQRRKMKFSSPGPLVEEDQHKLAKFIIDVCEKNFLDKPSNLKTYDYDVLFPEAVIWGLMKLENLTYKKAEDKYKKGFETTHEEIVRMKCNEIINKLSESVPTENDDLSKTIDNTELNVSDKSDSIPNIGNDS